MELPHHEDLSCRPQALNNQATTNSTPNAFIDALPPNTTSNSSSKRFQVTEPRPPHVPHIPFHRECQQASPYVSIVKYHFSSYRASIDLAKFTDISPSLDQEDCVNTIVKIEEKTAQKSKEDRRYIAKTSKITSSDQVYAEKTVFVDWICHERTSHISWQYQTCL